MLQYTNKMRYPINQTQKKKNDLLGGRFHTRRAIGKADIDSQRELVREHPYYNTERMGCQYEIGMKSENTEINCTAQDKDQ